MFETRKVAGSATHKQSEAVLNVLSFTVSLLIQSRTGRDFAYFVCCKNLSPRIIKSSPKLRSAPLNKTPCGTVSIAFSAVKIKPTYRTEMVTVHHVIEDVLSSAGIRRTCLLWPCCRGAVSSVCLSAGALDSAVTLHERET